jgi:hypothetical protein
MTDADRVTSVDFDPVPLRPPGRRRLDPAVVGVLAVALALVLAIVKPWGGAAGDGTADRPSPVARASEAPDAPVSAPGPIAAATDPRIAARYLSVLRTRDSWGIRAVIAAPGHPDLAERWVAAELGRRLGDDPMTTRLDASGNEVLALGVTTPADATPLAIRVWQTGPNGTLVWLDARRVASDLPAGELLLLPPTLDGEAARQWPAGDYRIDLLMGTWIERLGVRLARTAVVAEPSDDPTRPTTPPVGPDRAAMPPAWLGNVPAGAFAVVDGVVKPLPGEPGSTLQDAQAWLDVATGARAGAGAGHHVASTGRVGVTRIGVMLPGGAHAASGILRPLTSAPDFEGQPALVGDRVDASNNPTAFLLFRTPDGEPWPAGTYAIEATWIGPGGRQAATWHIVLTPGPVEGETNLLAAARAYGRFAGVDGLLIGSAEQLRDPVRAAGFQARAIEPDPATSEPSLGPIGCEGADFPAKPPVIGLGHPVDRVPSSVEITASGRLDQTIATRLRTAVDVVPGLTLLAPARGATFPDGVYRITIHDDRGVRELRVCLGTSPFGG